MKWLAAVFAIVLILASLIFILTGLQQLKEFVYDLDFDPQDDSQIQQLIRTQMGILKPQIIMMTRMQKMILKRS